MMEEKEEIKRQSSSKSIITLLALLILVVMVIGVSMATFTFTRESDEVNTISTGNISLDYTEDTNGITITNAFPMSDEAGKKISDENQYFDFTVKGTIQGDATIIYEVAAEKNGTCTLDDQEVRLYLEKKTSSGMSSVMVPKVFTPVDAKTKVGTPKGAMVLVKESVHETTATTYRLRMWVGENAVITDIPKRFAVQVVVNAKVEV